MVFELDMIVSGIAMFECHTAYLNVTLQDSQTAICSKSSFVISQSRINRAATKNRTKDPRASGLWPLACLWPDWAV